MRDYPTLHLDTSLQLSNTLIAAYLGIFAVFSSPGPKVHGNYCHHLASVNFSHFNLLLRNHWANWNQTLQFLFFVPVRYSTWLPGPIICSDWLKFQRSSSLKLMNWLNPNCKWMIIGMSFTKFLFLCGSEIQDGHHHRT